jgi:hypothetical protein
MAPKLITAPVKSEFNLMLKSIVAILKDSGMKIKLNKST